MRLFIGIIIGFLLSVSLANADVTVKGNIKLKKNNTTISKATNWRTIATKKQITVKDSIYDIEQKQKKEIVK